MDALITVYGKPGCQQCRMTTRHLDRLQVEYTYRDVTTDQDAHDIVTMLGYLTLPVVVAGDVHWAGFRHERLDRLAEIQHTAPDLAEHEQPAERYLAAADPDDEPCARCGFHTTGLLDDDGVCPDCRYAEDGAA
ncbi:glutaredoxin family protein [Nocardia asiatica]